MQKLLPFAIGSLLAAPNLAHAGELKISVELPRMTIAEYHKPYVAIWLERPDHTFAGNLALWYDIKKADGEGTKWLKDLRQWWRRSGRELSLPIDGLSSATRTSGVQTLSLSTQAAVFAGLTPGDYQLQVEAVREGGGREVVQIPFRWPATSTSVSAQGKTELGNISLTIK